MTITKPETMTPETAIEVPNTAAGVTSSRSAGRAVGGLLLVVGVAFGAFYAGHHSAKMAAGTNGMAGSARNRRANGYSSLEWQSDQAESIANDLDDPPTSEPSKDVWSAAGEDSSGNIYIPIENYGLAKSTKQVEDGSWSQISTHSWVKAKTEGVVVFEHSSKTLMAMAQPDGGKLRIVEISGSSVSTVSEFDASSLDTHCDGTGFTTGDNYASANTYFTGVGAEFKPSDVTFDGSDTLYIVNGFAEDDGQFVVTLKNSAGTWGWSTVAFGGHGSDTGKFDAPEGIAMDDGSVLVCDTGNTRLQRFSTAGAHQSPTRSLPADTKVTGAHPADDGMMIFSTAEDANGDSYIHIITGDGELSSIVFKDGSGVAEPYNHLLPHYMKADPLDTEDTLYVLETGLYCCGGFGYLKPVSAV